MTYKCRSCVRGRLSQDAEVCRGFPWQFTQAIKVTILPPPAAPSLLPCCCCCCRLIPYPSQFVPSLFLLLWMHSEWLHRLWELSPLQLCTAATFILLRGWYKQQLCRHLVLWSNSSWSIQNCVNGMSPQNRHTKIPYIYICNHLSLMYDILYFQDTQCFQRSSLEISTTTPGPCAAYFRKDSAVFEGYLRGQSSVWRCLLFDRWLSLTLI